MIMIEDRAANSRIEAELVGAFRTRLRTDAVLSLLGNTAVLAIALIAFRNDAPAALLLGWTAAVMASTSGRAAWQRSAAISRMDDASLLRGTRLALALQGLSWGAGAGFLAHWLPTNEMALLMAGFAGITGSALSTLTADTRGFHLLVLGINGPLLIGLLTTSADPSHLVMAAMVVVFVITMRQLHKRVHRGLIKHLQLVDRLSTSEKAQAKLIAELRTALSEVKQLTGLLPICANCKKVRDDFGYWNSVEHYISEHTDAKFSHGVCPDCFPKLFPGIPLPEPEEEHV